MREDFLHFLWRWRRFDAAELQTTQGLPLEILHPGEHNTHAGPDFFNARIRLDGTLWAGNVEIHVNASEWLQHGHDTDPAYDNVVLHVVLDEDMPLLRPNGERIPCLSLRRRIPPRLIATYRQLEHERHWIPCAEQFASVPEIVRLNWLDRLMVERLEEKTGYAAEMLERASGQWEEAFYHILARNYGLKVNAEPFETLARNTPLLLLARHRNQLFQLEALLFGQAGMLEAPLRDEYPQALAREYRHLRHKYTLAPMNGSQWKFFRLRPSGFPGLRIAQFAALIHRSDHLFSDLLEARNLREIELFFHTETSAYWRDHFQFDKPSVRKDKTPGREFIHLLIINTIAPFMFLYGKKKNIAALQQRALRLLEELPPESNALIEGWTGLGMPARSAFHSQALIHLKTHYCDAHRCLDCAVGNVLLR